MEIGDGEEVAAELAQHVVPLEIQAPSSVDGFANLDAQANVHAALTDEERARAAQEPNRLWRMLATLMR